jgi:hypothetical protein
MTAPCRRPRLPLPIVKLQTEVRCRATCWLFDLSEVNADNQDGNIIAGHPVEHVRLDLVGAPGAAASFAAAACASASVTATTSWRVPCGNAVANDSDADAGCGLS